MKNLITPFLTVLLLSGTATADWSLLDISGRWGRAGKDKWTFIQSGGDMRVRAPVKEVPLLSGSIQQTGWKSFRMSVYTYGKPDSCVGRISLDMEGSKSNDFTLSVPDCTLRLQNTCTDEYSSSDCGGLWEK